MDGSRLPNVQVLNTAALPSPEPADPRVGVLARALRQWARVWREVRLAHRTEKTLAGLDDRLLADIGVPRASIQAVSVEIAREAIACEGAAGGGPIARPFVAPASGCTGKA